ncbi:SDR family oxidoreductase [Sphingopyxis panaciterrulae]|uniref:NAD(P)-dependent dehydrogenase (Short-subunit alcohol dehydrogenase family) n=1 Tax=Sphingopyxis panaciterrulae TaxID=462372 RepID=A0A7W9ESY4_9SPHN|nr:SDR family oxidoreductase [Sphingopyxis panaciterrulae]MBB5707416.1 NAD(P)-dependent dehydrogenase (short-subunit alcohol dehydrogenase family) [Sphingopyxis panaciterrulae]
MRLEGKVALVTGASRGIGRAIAKRFADEGAYVAMLARGHEELERAAAEIGERTLPCPADIGDPESVRRIFGELGEKFGGLDILVNNAALATPNPIAEAVDADVQKEVAVNLLGPLYCSREAIPLMRARGGGDIVNISSESVNHPYPHLGLYAATKSALETLSVVLRTELADDHIRVTTYRSGNVRGTFSRGWSDEARTRARAAARDAGFYGKSGAQIEPEIPAETILTIVTLPREAQIDLIELRGAQPTSKTIATRMAADPSKV